MMQVIDYFLGVLFFGFPAAVLLALIALWWLVTIEAARPAARRRLGRHTGPLMLQITIFSGILGLITADPLVMVTALVFPPIWLGSAQAVLEFRPLLAQVAPPAALTVALVAVVMPAFRRLRAITPIVALCAGLATSLVVTERASVAAMCAAAKELGKSTVPRNPFIISLWNAPVEFQTYLHGYLDVDGRDYGWSYREMKFYDIPPGADFDVPKSLHRCGAL